MGGSVCVGRFGWVDGLVGQFGWVGEWVWVGGWVGEQVDGLVVE